MCAQAVIADNWKQSTLKAPHANNADSFSIIQSDDGSGSIIVTLDSE